MNQTPFNYNEAINPKSFVICSLELKPFSLGHYILLEQIQSPFLTDNPDTSVELEFGLTHFLMCLLICGQSYEDGLTMLSDDAVLRSTVRTFQKNLFKSMKKDKNWNVYEKLFMFKEYIRYFTQMPIFQIETKSDRAPSGIDWKQNLFTIAKNEWGYTDSEILNMPLRRLFFEWCSYAEKGGGIRVQNANEMEFLKMALEK